MNIRQCKDRFLVSSLIFLSSFTYTVDGQACGTIYQVPFCREDCGSCAAMPCCTLEWDLPENSAMDFVMKLIDSAKRGGPDGLFTLQGHLEKYPEFSTDIYDDSPRNVQVCSHNRTDRMSSDTSFKNRVYVRSGNMFKSWCKASE
jgi:hypothetical protein